MLLQATALEQDREGWSKRALEHTRKPFSSPIVISLSMLSAKA
jgi:hypothetical protein